jgi:hypothetical protein
MDRSASVAREHRPAERLARCEPEPLVKQDGGEVVGKDVQEGRDAFRRSLQTSQATKNAA